MVRQSHVIQGNRLARTVAYLLINRQRLLVHGERSLQLSGQAKQGAHIVERRCLAMAMPDGLEQWHGLFIEVQGLLGVPDGLIEERYIIDDQGLICSIPLFTTE